MNESTETTAASATTAAPAPSPSEDVFSTLMAPDARTDPYRTYRRFREETPILDTGLGATFVFTHDVCQALLRDRRTSVDERNSLFGGQAEEHPTLIHLDPPDHDRLRRLVQAAFTPRRVELLRTRAAEVTDSLLATFDDTARATSNGQIDLIANLAYPMPLQIICDLLGVSASDHAVIKEWSAILARSIDPGPLRDDQTKAAIATAEAEFCEFLRALIQFRRRVPGDDILSVLSNQPIGSDALTEPELLGLALLLLVAGHETTVNLIGNAMNALLAHPDQFQMLHNGSVPIKRAVDEFLRFDSPVQMTTRIPLEDLTVGDSVIPAGHFAVLMLGAANHDPAVFEAPHRLNISLERTTPHLAFGTGLHHCLGAALARAEAEVSIGALTRRYPNMSLAAPGPVRDTFVLRGRTELMVNLGGPL